MGVYSTCNPLEWKFQGRGWGGGVKTKKPSVGYGFLE